MDRRVIMILAMFKACLQKEPVRSQLLYYYAMAREDVTALLLPDDISENVTAKVCVW